MLCARWCARHSADLLLAPSFVRILCVIYCIMPKIMWLKWQFSKSVNSRHTGFLIPLCLAPFVNIFIFLYFVHRNHLPSAYFYDLKALWKWMVDMSTIWWWWWQRRRWTHCLDSYLSFCAKPQGHHEIKHHRLDQMLESAQTPCNRPSHWMECRTMPSLRATRRLTSIQSASWCVCVCLCAITQ